MDYSRFITDLSRRRKPDLIREIVSLSAATPNPELVFLAVGSPNNATVPYSEISFTINDGMKITLEYEEMMEALQYGPTRGYPPLLFELKNLVKKFHSPPSWENSDTIVTAGALDVLSKAIEMMLSPNDYFITQEALFMGTLNIVRPYLPKLIPIPYDNLGLNPKLLRAALSNWSPEVIKDKKEGIPKILYVNPNGNNPTGTTMSEDRKREIYKIASEYNLIILEDDPYYFLQFSEMKDFVPSFLSMDVDGRVIRFDSFSKLVSPGIRLGFATGPKPFIDRIQLHMQSTFLHTSGLSQIMVHKTLKYWGHKGLENHVNRLKNIYMNSRDIMLAAANRYLIDLCEWFVPTSGMFFWIKVIGVTDTYDMILKRGMKKNIILLPGSLFMANLVSSSQYLRASYSNATPEEIDKGIKCLADLIKEEIIDHRKGVERD